MKRESNILALDIGGVCMHVELQRFYGGIGFAEPPSWLRDLVLNLNLGRLSPEEFFFAVREGLSMPQPNPEHIRELFGSLLVEANPGMRELVASLPERGVRPVFFSDINRPHVERTLALLDAKEIITDGIFSYKAGAFKPSETMLNAFETRFGKPLLYVDDLPENIAGAQTHGWNAVVFESAAQVDSILKGFGC